MRIALVLTVLVVLAVCSSDAGWLRRYWRRNKTRILKAGLAYFSNRKRGVSELDVNNDGMIDQSEIQSFISTRDAEQLFDGDDVSVEEFEQALKNIISS